MHVHYCHLADVDLGALWERLDAWGAEPPAPALLLRRGNTRRVYLTEVSPGQRVVIKVWLRSHGTTRLKRQSLLHSGHNEAAMTALAADRGVGPYQPLAFAERGRGRRRQLLLMLPFLEDHLAVETLVTDAALPPATLDALVQEFGRALGRIHARGLIHNDYKLDNALVPAAAPDPAAAMAIIDWGKTWEPDGDLRRHQLAELVYACSSMVRARIPDHYRQPFLDGYATEMAWFAEARPDIDQQIEEGLRQTLRRTNRRIWRNATRQARRLESGRRHALRYLVLKGVDPDLVLAACTGESDGFRTSEEQAVAVWRAANVLQAMGLADDTVVGLVRRRRWLGRQRAWLVYRADRPAPDGPAMLAQANRYL